MLSTKQKKILAYKCARCFTENADKLARFFSRNSIYRDSLLCNPCFKKMFSQLTINQKKEWGFYDKKN